MNLTTGERIATARRRADVKQEDLAVSVGVSRSTLAKVEAGRVSPRLELLQAIAAQLDVECSELLGVS